MCFTVPLTFCNSSSGVCVFCDSFWTMNNFVSMKFNHPDWYMFNVVSSLEAVLRVVTSQGTTLTFWPLPPIICSVPLSLNRTASLVSPPFGLLLFCCRLHFPFTRHTCHSLHLFQPACTCFFFFSSFPLSLFWTADPKYSNCPLSSYSVFYKESLSFMHKYSVFPEAHLLSCPLHVKLPSLYIFLHLYPALTTDHNVICKHYFPWRFLSQLAGIRDKPRCGQAMAQGTCWAFYSVLPNLEKFY